jgi:hypothetical protein
LFSVKGKHNLKGLGGTEMEMRRNIEMRINENVRRDKDVRTKKIRIGTEKENDVRRSKRRIYYAFLLL